MNKYHYTTGNISSRFRSLKCVFVAHFICYHINSENSKKFKNIMKTTMFPVFYLFVFTSRYKYIYVFHSTLFMNTNEISSHTYLQLICYPILILAMWYRENTSSRFSSNTEANASELLDNFEFYVTDSGVWMMNTILYGIHYANFPASKGLTKLYIFDLSYILFIKYDFGDWVLGYFTVFNIVLGSVLFTQNLMFVHVSSRINYIINLLTFYIVFLNSQYRKTYKK